MKNKNVAKKFVGLILAFVMIMGLAMPAFADGTRWTNGRLIITIEDDVATVVTTGTQQPDSAVLTITNVVSIAEFDSGHANVDIVPVVYATAPVTVTALMDLSGGGHTGGAVYRFGADNYYDWHDFTPARLDEWEPHTQFWTDPHLALAPTTGHATTTGRVVSAGSTYVLDVDIYLLAPGVAGPRMWIIVLPPGAQASTPPTPPPTQPNNLNTASAWAHESITNAIATGLVPQSLQNHYTNNITRAEFTALAVLLYETATGREITGRVIFNDTTDVNVQKAAYIGVISGTGNNNFSPNMQFNREQAAVMVSRLAEAIGQPLPASSPAFADNADISSWAREQTGQAQAAGIITGVGDNMFNPRGTFTREQSIILMLRLFEYFS